LFYQTIAMATDIRTQSLEKPVAVAEYLFRRLHQLGIRSVHGLPGDFNLVALDYIPKTGLKWVGSVNELNAGMFLTPIRGGCTHHVLLASLCGRRLCSR
jgi:hypothetical protein